MTIANRVRFAFVIAWNLLPGSDATVVSEGITTFG
jgi:hypothetical protein